MINIKYLFLLYILILYNFNLVYSLQNNYKGNCDTYIDIEKYYYNSYLMHLCNENNYNNVLCSNVKIDYDKYNKILLTCHNNSLFYKKEQDAINEYNKLK